MKFLDNDDDNVEEDEKYIKVQQFNSFVAKAYRCLGERCARIRGNTDGLKWNLRVIELSFNYKYAKTVTHTVLLKFSSH